MSTLAKDALEYYVDGNGYNVNNALRFGSDMDEEDEKLLKGLDEATSKSLDAMTLYRVIYNLK